MTTVVVPFAGTEGKTRLDASRSTRRDLSLAMLADVLAAAVVVGRTLVVTGDPAGVGGAGGAGGVSRDDERAAGRAPRCGLPSSSPVATRCSSSTQTFRV